MDTVERIFSLGWSMGQAPKELQNELDQLRIKVPSARLIISRSEWGMVNNKDLEALLLQLKYTTYDAEDLLREFEDKILQQQNQGPLMTFLRDIRSYIHGSHQRVRETKDKLGQAMAEVEKVLGLMGLDRVGPGQVMPTTTEIITASQVFGRDTERVEVMEMLGVTATIERADEINQVMTQLGMSITMGSTSAGAKKKRAAAAAAGHVIVASTPVPAKRPKGNRSSSSGLAEKTNFIGNISVLPIFGIGGMGKTTLAQLIYHDRMVEAHFTVRIWVCVSDLFDIERMTKEIVKTISDPNFDLPCGLGALQAELKERLKSQKFLLVLDDIWQIALQQWESFFAPLRHGLEGSMILVTTRHANIAHLVATSNCKPVQLEGLPADIFSEFFEKCAFNNERPESYPRLQEILRSIAPKLCGTPLAAKTLGRLLNSNLTEQHWMTINNSELWEQEQKEGEILPALRLSYLYLPTELRRCFAFCSMFPKDYSFKRHEIVNIWVAEGFVAPLGSMCLEDVGIRYLDELRGRCLLHTDPKFPNQDRYVMHDLIHDTAQYVSMHECFSLKDLSGIIYTIRHMSVEMDGKSLSKMACIVPHLNKLRSLRCSTKLDIEITWLSQLSNILFLSLRGCKLEKLPQSICQLYSLRYLDISESQIKELPERFRYLYSLQVVDASDSRLRTIHQDVTTLINLRQLALPKGASIALSMVRGLGNLSCLRNLSYFTVGRQNGGFDDLKGMNQLRGTLCIKSICAIKNKEEAAAARLVDKKYLKELELHWRTNPGTCRLNCHENNVIDGLCPNERIQGLKVHGFVGDRLPSWFNPKDLQNLRSLKLSCCPHFKSLAIPHFDGGTQGGPTGQHASTSINFSNVTASLAFTHLTAVSLVNCCGLKHLDQFLSPKNLPSIESILLEDCRCLVSIPANSFVGFVHLRDLKLRCSHCLLCPQPREMVLPPSLRRLFIDSCGQLDRSFPSCLEKVPSLTVLCLVDCHNIMSIPLDSIPCKNTLKFLVLGSCPNLSSIGGSGIPASIEYVSVYSCFELTQVQQPYKKNGWRMTKEAREDTDFIKEVRGRF